MLHNKKKYEVEDMAYEYAETELLVEFPLLRLNSTPSFLMNGVSGGRVVREEKPGIKSLQNLAFLRKCFRGLETTENFTQVLLSRLHGS